MFPSTMTRRRRPSWWLGVGLLVLLVTTSACVKVQAGDGGVVWGGSIVVEEGEVSRQELVALGGSIRVDGEARSEVVVIGGNLEINGVAGSDVVVVGGAMRLGPRSRVHGDVVVIGGGLDREPGAEIDGEVVSVGWAAGVPGVDGGWYWPFGGMVAGYSWWGVSPFDVAWRTTQLLYWLLLAVLTVALVGDRVSSASHSIAREPLRLGLIGLVGFFALLLAATMFGLLSIVLIGLPFFVATFLLWWLAYIFGMVAVFQLLGDRVAKLFNRPQMSQLGLVLVGGLALSLLRYFPLFGTAFWWVGGFLGLGAVFATRFGSGRPWFGGPTATPPATPPPGGRAPQHEPAGTPGAPGGPETGQASTGRAGAGRAGGRSPAPGPSESGPGEELGEPRYEEPRYDEPPPEDGDRRDDDEPLG